MTEVYIVTALLDTATLIQAHYEADQEREPTRDETGFYRKEEGHRRKWSEKVISSVSSKVFPSCTCF